MTSCMSELSIFLVIFKVVRVIKNSYVISYQIFLKLFLIGLSDFSASIERKFLWSGLAL